MPKKKADIKADSGVETKVEKTTKEDLVKESELASEPNTVIPNSSVLSDPLSEQVPESVQLWDVQIKLSGGMIGVATVRAINKIMAEHMVRMSVTFEASKNYSKN